MQVVQVKIIDLKPADYNPRKLTKDQHRDLTESIKRFGLVDPIIVNQHTGRENVVVGGHQRLKIAQEQGFEEVPVVYVDLDEEREKELNLRLNKNLGEWDWDSLANNFDNDFLESIGFTKDDLFFSGSESVAPVADSRVLTIEPPESPQLKERVQIRFDNIEDYKKVKEMVAKVGEMEIIKMFLDKVGQ